MKQSHSNNIPQSAKTPEGVLTYLQALKFEEQGRDLSEPVELKDIIATIFGKLSKSETNESLTEEIIKKRANHHRSVIKNMDVNKQRIDQGFPVGGFRPKKRPSP
jgi:hypothetical protein